MSDDYDTWSLKDTISMYTAMERMDTVLNGNLKRLTSGWGMRFRKTPYDKGDPIDKCTLSYCGLTAGAFINFYADGKGVPYQNIYHEFGHLINSAAASVLGFKIVGWLSAASVYDRKGGFVLGNNGNQYIRTDLGYRDASVWDGNRNEDVRALQHPASDDGGVSANEEWPDMWANYVIGNINMGNAPGRARNDWTSVPVFILGHY
jgi:hypothetical protein